MSGDSLLRFDVYELNPESGELRKGGTPLKLPPQPARALVLLASRPGELVTRDELRRELWGDETVVDFEQGLNFCIRRVRAALLDDAQQPRFIETVPRRGYRFMVPVHRVSTAPRMPRWLRFAVAGGAVATIAVAVLFTSRVDRYPPNPVAYAQYRKGRFLVEESQRDGQKKSIEYYQDAIAHDPGYASAYAGLASAYVANVWLSQGGPEYIMKARSAALKSLELDPRLAAGHASLAYCLYQDWQWASAEQEFRKAIDLAPRDPDARFEFSMMLSSQGRHEEALRQSRRAMELEPVSAFVSFALAHDLWMARRYDEAIAESQRILELHPEMRMAYNVIGHCYAQKGMYQEAAAAFHEFYPKLPQSASPFTAYLLALAGKKKDAQAAMTQAMKTDLWLSKFSHSLGPTAQYYVAMGENGRAIDWLEQSFFRHEAGLVWAATRPEYDGLRAEPRFTALLQKMGLAP